jgi:hypothetical protein
MSTRRPPQAHVAKAAALSRVAPGTYDVSAFRAALDAHATATAALSTKGYFDVSDRSIEVAEAERAGHAADIEALFEMIHPDFHPHPDATEEEIDAWYDSVVSGAKKAYSATKKLGKDGYQKVKENVKPPL